MFDEAPPQKRNIRRKIRGETPRTGTAGRGEQTEARGVIESKEFRNAKGEQRNKNDLRKEADEQWNRSTKILDDLSEFEAAADAQRADHDEENDHGSKQCVDDRLMPFDRHVDRSRVEKRIRKIFQRRTTLKNFLGIERRRGTSPLLVRDVHRGIILLFVAFFQIEFDRQRCNADESAENGDVQSFGLEKIRDVENTQTFQLRIDQRNVRHVKKRRTRTQFRGDVPKIFFVRTSKNVRRFEMIDDQVTTLDASQNDDEEKKRKEKILHHI